MFTKVCSGFFLILFRYRVECAETRSFLIFAKNPRSKKKKNPEHAFVVLGARKIFKFFSNKPGFSKTIEVCLNFYM